MTAPGLVLLFTGFVLAVFASSDMNPAAGILSAVCIAVGCDLLWFGWTHYLQRRKEHRHD